MGLPLSLLSMLLVLLISGVVALAVTRKWVRLRFSLRSLLIFTTLVAVIRVR